MEVTTFDMVIGKTFSAINVDTDRVDFMTTKGEKCVLWHNQDCCESVTVEDVIGDINDLIGSPILKAEEVTSNENPPDITKDYQDSFTWTFYNFATAKGHVTIRWYGSSNGWYSEMVDFVLDGRILN